MVSMNFFPDSAVANSAAFFFFFFNSPSHSLSSTSASAKNQVAIKKMKTQFSSWQDCIDLNEIKVLFPFFYFLFW